MNNKKKTVALRLIADRSPAQRPERPHKVDCPYVEVPFINSVTRGVRPPSKGSFKINVRGHFSNEEGEVRRGVLAIWKI